MTIEFSNFSFKYFAQAYPTLKNINLKIKRGEKVLILGPSGSGKSTLGQCLNGLIPHAIKGSISGCLTFDGEDVRDFQMEDYTKRLGTVLQDTDNQFVGLSIGEDIAFALENQLTSHETMHSVVKETAALVNLEEMLTHSPHELSGGQKQRVSLAGVLVDEVDFLLFDEPLSALDPVTSQKTIEIIDELHSKMRKTIIIIEHRLEDVLRKQVDRIILMDKGSIVMDGSPDSILSASELVKQGIREPLYLSALKASGVEIHEHHQPSQLINMPLDRFKSLVFDWFDTASYSINPVEQYAPLLAVESLSYSYDGVTNALENVTFNVKRGEMISILGKNGSGKSTLTKLIMGMCDLDEGRIVIGDKDLSQLSIFERSKKVGLVLQNPNHMISHHMIYDEVAFALKNSGLDVQSIQDRVESVLKTCGLYSQRNWPIDALSFGQKKRVTIASILINEPDILILDEPTAGQDYRNYTSMMKFIQKLNQDMGITVIIISHDLHLVLEYTTRALIMADGKLIADASVTKLFSMPELLARANLAPTSLYQLANALGINDVTGFMKHYIESVSVV